MNHPPPRIHLDKAAILDLVDDARTLVRSTAGIRVEVVLDDITWLQMLQAFIDTSGLSYIARQRLRIIIEGIAPQQRRQMLRAIIAGTPDDPPEAREFLPAKRRRK
jgi:hypothetical protein